MEPSHEFMEVPGKLNEAIVKNLKPLLVNVLCRPLSAILEGPRALWLKKRIIVAYLVLL